MAQNNYISSIDFNVSIEERIKRLKSVKITEDYVSFETAKLLKEKGFVESCLMRYNKVGDLVEEAYKFNWNFQTIDYSAPTLQMAMKWFLKNIISLYVFYFWKNITDLDILLRIQLQRNI